ncbi:hypothetical protein MKZ38_006659 [Zalerion maritima]|uniref:NIF3-like protein n=1 Tax=Zalerion maritima TaxID=339359 RepID=A0AAD5RVG6_9PEZI|nr:hypothetical protein MKZ38_006659 [Zalerion maritima]
MEATSGKPLNFTAQVVSAMDQLYPLALADKRWDNVGLLLDNFPVENQQPVVLLANDLTSAVCEEAIAKQASVVIAYRTVLASLLLRLVLAPPTDHPIDPFIFRGLKSITHHDTQQSSLLKLARHGIAVYSPHTSVDAAPGGINDWLADACLGDNIMVTENSNPLVEESRSVLQPVPTSPLPDGFEVSKTGYGRKIVLKAPVAARRILSNLKENLGVKFANVAFRQPDTINAVMAKEIKSFAVCAGSGSDVLGDCDADVLVTGELSHHAALRFAERGQICVMLMHSSSERGFLTDRMAPKLAEVLMMAEVPAQVVVSERDAEIFHVYTG